jgi:hypothetical protein
MFTKGMMKLNRHNLQAYDISENVLSTYGFEDGGISCGNTDNINTPRVVNPLSISDYELLLNMFSPLENDRNFGIDLYENVLAFVSGCN